MAQKITIKEKIREEKIARQAGLSEIMKTSQREDRAKESYAKMGTRTFIPIGVEDRLKGNPYDEASLKDKKIVISITKGDIISYHYGYYKRANEIIALRIKYPEIRKDLVVKEIGYSDAKNNISLEDIPEEIKNSKEYLEGYREGLKNKKEGIKKVGR